MSSKISEDMYLTLDDVLLKPQYSEITSRLDTDLSTRLTKNIKLKYPIISASMDTVTGFSLASKMSELGGCGFLHRFETDSEILWWCEQLTSSGRLAIPSIGIRKDVTVWARKLIGAGVKVVSIDIAHAHSLHVLKTIELLKGVFPDLEVIGGNVATAEGTQALINAGADAVKVGVGSGSLCSTRLVTGHGVPTVSALLECVETASKYDTPIIADGGIRYSGDMVKCLGLGAETCMVGSLLAGTEETPGDIIKIGGKLFKEYRGMSSESAQRAFKGGLKRGTAAEGEATTVRFRGPVEPIVMQLMGGIRSGLTYAGAKNLKELRERAEFIKITNSSIIEGTPHRLKG